MPTIEDLPPVVAAADTDELPAFQSGECRKVTRAQLLAGMQVGIAVAPNALLGRSSSGTGAPENIAVGQNLRLSAGVLTGPAPFTSASLPAGRMPFATDLVVMGQSGADAGVAYGPFQSGLASLSGIDLSRHLARPTGGLLARSLADSLGDTVTVEAFGAVGDGVTDCTDAINAAVSSGRQVLFGPGTYLLRGQCTIPVPAALVGVAGQTVLRRPVPSVQAGGAWIAVQGASFSAHGIVFDANHHPAESWGVLVTDACARAVFRDCTFANATGPSLGTGLAFLPNAAASHAVSSCEFRGNAVHGVWVRASNGVHLAGCIAHGNGAYGLCVDDDDPALARQVRNVVVAGNTCWNNARGISVGNYNQTNAQPPVWGNAHPDVVGAAITGNTCFGNTAYGLALAGQALLASGNVLTGNGPDGAGILFNACLSRLEDNVVVAAPGSFGIDAGGCSDCEVVGNSVSGAAVGLNVGGSQRVRAAGNRLDGNGWGITVYNVETDGQGADFGQGTAALTLRGNRITFGGAGGGITLIDGPQTVLVADNEFFGTDTADIAQCLWAHTDSAVVRGNSWNNEARRIVNPSPVGPIRQIILPDIADDIMVTDAPGGVQSITTRHAQDVAGTVAFIRVARGGTGYTAATVTVTGRGAGAGAIAYVRDGAVVGIALTQAGHGYDAATAVTLTGDGQGATATAFVGLQPLEDRRLRIHCNAPTRFDRAAASPALDNWTLGSLTVPAGSCIDWTVTWGAWRATAFALGEFVAPPGDGSVVLRTLPGGDLVLRPAGSGAIRLSSDGATTGCTLTVGHGSPEGVVVAPPGSDYRNLDGGAGATLWIKRSGADAHGWSAIA